MRMRLSKILFISMFLFNLQSAVADDSSANVTQIQPQATSTVGESPSATNSNTAQQNQTSSSNPGTDAVNPYGGAYLNPKVADVVTFHTDTIACSSEIDLEALLAHFVNKEITLAKMMLNNQICGVIPPSTQKFRVVSTDNLGNKLVIIQFVNANNADNTSGLWTMAASVKEILP